MAIVRREVCAGCDGVLEEYRSPSPLCLDCYLDTALPYFWREFHKWWNEINKAR